MGEIVERLGRIKDLGLWIHGDNTSNLLENRLLTGVMTNSILKDRVNCCNVLRSLKGTIDDVYLAEQSIVLDVLDKYMDDFDNKDYILLVAGASVLNDVRKVFDVMADEFIGEDSMSLRDSQVFNKIGYEMQSRYTEILVELMYIEEALLVVRHVCRD